jgi:hypothetical protein
MVVAVKVLTLTPPFGAAAAAARTGLPGMRGLLLLCVWLVLLILVLVAMERLPATRRRPESATMKWQSGYERIANWFAPEDAPFVAHWLRFYVRNTRFRTMYFLTFPLLGFLIYNMSRNGGPSAIFPTAVGVFGVAGFIGTSRMAVNQFGYTGGGFRRFFLLPTDPAASLRSGCYAAMMLGGTVIPLMLLGWVLLAPIAFDARAVFMLLASGVSGLFIFHALGLWVSMLNPRKGNYYSNFGNDLSLWGNIVLIGGILTCLSIPQILRKTAPGVITPRHWWMSALLAALAAVFFRVSLERTGGLLRQRREQLLAVVEGRD